MRPSLHPHFPRDSISQRPKQALSQALGPKSSACTSSLCKQHAKDPRGILLSHPSTSPEASRAVGQPPCDLLQPPLFFPLSNLSFSLPLATASPAHRGSHPFLLFVPECSALFLKQVQQTSGHPRSHVAVHKHLTHGTPCPTERLTANSALPPRMPLSQDSLLRSPGCLTNYGSQPRGPPDKIGN